MKTLPRIWYAASLVALVGSFLSPRAAAQTIAPRAEIGLSRARMVVDPGLTAHEKNAVAMLVDEVEKRTALRWSAEGSGPAIAIHHARGAGPAEGYRLQSTAAGVDIRGYDERGTLFGIGRFLRELRWDHLHAALPAGLDISSAPQYVLRGHQIGYRPKVNTYDAWKPADFEQYLRDMVIFGTNAVELIPPRSDDDDDSPHFHLSKIDMMVEMSRICDKYGIDVWIWYPAMDQDYSDPAQVQFALKEWGEVFRTLPRIDGVFVPGGDPGHAEPKYLMALLEKETAVLHERHPKAQVWVSPQGFNAAWLDEFLAIVKTEPTWLSGIVYGPWVRLPPDDLRARIPQRFPMQLYPDITHTTHAEYPVPDWDIAFAVTEAREPINPRPIDYSPIFRHTMPTSIGFISYSEGVNDDVNKFVWSALGWDSQQDVGAILREWARWFISPRYETGIAQALLDLEENWRGPLLPHGSVDATLAKVQALERAATPQMLLNWRFQQVLYRAYYDGFVRQRLLYETGLEQQAMERLAEAPRQGSLPAVEEASRILDQAVTKPAAENLRSRVLALGEALYQSIHMQLSVDRYHAIAVSRGANLDTLDFPLNNRVWLQAEFAKLRKLDSERARLAAIAAILHRSDSGPGGFYDDLGNPAMQPHLVNEGPGYANDPGGYHSVLSEYAACSGGLIGRSSAEALRPDGPAAFIVTPMAWWTWAETRYETPLTMRYEQLDPHAQYRVRAVFVGRPGGTRIRLEADGKIEVHPWIQRPATTTPMEFPIPAEATRDGTLTLRWYLEPGQAGSGEAIDIAEVFLIQR